MTWHYDHPHATQGTTPVNYYTYRHMGGYIQMRLTDVIAGPHGDYHFSTAAAGINLIDRHGNVVCDVLLSKTWGVIPAYKTLAHVPRMDLRFQVTTWVDNRQLSNDIITWKSDLRWDNSLPEGGF